MRILPLDDDYALSRKKLWPKAFKTAMVFIGVLWSIFILDGITPFIQLNSYGIHPRHISGITGIIASPFLHGNMSHIISNTLPLLIAMTALFGNYPKIAKKVLIYSAILTGLLVWCFARSANHIGASGILYAILTFIFISGFIRKDMQSIGISIVVAFAYGSLIFGIIPNKQHISWEAHLFGMLTGAFLAWAYRRREIPIYKSWDEEE
ncbi:MAG: rhomboid family intramembrane serine protease [Proteobacteria bacterium]|nr:rhomboid family intramembrane serine protease [Pseudomonadota bacterium]